jgi:3-dehydroquinate dehydratase-2
MKILVLNGPNLNFLGIREPDIYGKSTLKNLEQSVTETFPNQNIMFQQSNSEGQLIDYLQQAYYDKVDGIVFNPGAYTHYSYALLDAIKSIGIPTVEVHLSDISDREDFRKVSVTLPACVKQFAGKGFNSYIEAISFLQDYNA